MHNKHKLGSHSCEADALRPKRWRSMNTWQKIRKTQRMNKNNQHQILLSLTKILFSLTPKLQDGNKSSDDAVTFEISRQLRAWPKKILKCRREQNLEMIKHQESLNPGQNWANCPL